MIPNPMAPIRLFTTKHRVKKNSFEKHLEPLYDIFAGAAVGDFSKDLKAPDDLPPQFEPVYSGIMVMLDVIRAQIASAQQINDILLRDNKSKNAFLASIIESSKDAIFSIDADGNITSWNPSARSLFNYDAPEVMGKHYTILLPKTSKAEVAQLYARAEKSGGISQFETLLAKKDGSTVYVSLTLSPILRSDNKKGEGMSCIVRNITEKKRLENQLAIYAKSLRQKVRERTAELEKEKIQAKAILESIGEGILVVEADSMRISHINKAGGDMLECEEGGILQKKLNDVIPLIDSSRQFSDHESLVRHVIQSGETFAPLPPSTFSFVKKSGGEFPVSLTVSPIQINGDSRPAGAIAVFKDISKGKEIDRAKSEFISLASHQLRTPPSIISMYAEMLLNDAQSLTGEQASFVEEIYLANKRMMNLINNLLHVSRIELKKFSVSRTEYTDIKNVISSTMRNYSSHIKEKELSVAVDVSDTLPTVPGERTYISIIVDNIISNAIKYTPSKGSVHVSAKKEKRHIVFSVKDTGCGIPRKQHNKIFSKMFRAENAKLVAGEGTGLGLYLSRSIAEELGGSISFDSKEGEGTTFSVTLPILLE